MPCDASDPLQCLILAARRLATPAPKNQASSGLLSASASVSWRPKYASCFLQLSKPQEWTEWCTLGPGGWTNKSGFINAITAITTIRVEVSVWDRTSPGSFQIEKNVKTLQNCSSPKITAAVGKLNRHTPSWQRVAWVVGQPPAAAEGFLVSRRNEPQLSLLRNPCDLWIPCLVNPLKFLVVVYFTSLEVLDW